MAFQYRARDISGHIMQGILDAASLDDATRQLRRDGLTVLHIDEVDEGELGIFSRRITKNEIIYVTNQLAIMIDTGITLSVALQAIIDQEENPSLRTVLRQIKDRVEAGEDFSEALATYPKLFNTIYVSLVKASEATGTLAEMLDRIAGYLRKEVEARGKVRSAMAYPMVMVVMAIGVSIFLLTYILPKFQPLFERKGAALPLPTKIMLTVSDAITDYWFVWLALFVAIIAGFVVARRTQRGRELLDWARINLPVIGPMYRKIIISRSLRTLGAMVGGGVSLLDALDVCARVSGNCFYERLWRHVADQVTQGKRIRDGLEGNPLFPPTLVQMIASGEEAGKLPRVLERVGDYYDTEVENALKTATSLIEPLLIAVMGVVVGGIGLALMLPIFRLSQPGH